MKKNLSFELFYLILALLPVAYQAYVYPQLPDTVALHYGPSGQPDAFGPKAQLWLPVGILSVTTLLVGLLLRFLPQIDPKRNLAQSTKMLSNIRLLVSIFMSAIGLFVVHSAVRQSAEALTEFMPFAMLVLMAFLGNSMINIKPNYFAGIRTPWTLESETVWRQTHQFGGRLMFWGSMALLPVLFLFSPSVRLFVAVGAIMLFAMVSVVYSYLVFRRLHH